MFVHQLQQNMQPMKWKMESVQVQHDQSYNTTIKYEWKINVKLTNLIFRHWSLELCNRFVLFGMLFVILFANFNFICNYLQLFDLSSSWNNITVSMRWYEDSFFKKRLYVKVSIYSVQRNQFFINSNSIFKIVKNHFNKLIWKK